MPEYFFGQNCGAGAIIAEQAARDWAKRAIDDAINAGQSVDSSTIHTLLHAAATAEFKILQNSDPEYYKNLLDAACLAAYDFYPALVTVVGPRQPG